MWDGRVGRGSESSDDGRHQNRFFRCVIMGDRRLSEFDVDPSNSLVIPSLELSNYDAWADSPRMPEHIVIPGSTGDPELDSDHDSDGSMEYDRFSDHSDSTGFGWMVMSSRVSEADGEPREYMF